MANIYEKLDLAREEIFSKQINKEGVGDTGTRKYNYFRLEEIIPLVKTACKNQNLFYFTTFGDNEGTLTIINLDNIDEKIAFKTPISTNAMRGGTEVQNIGAMHTYLRRYLYVLAFDIIEHDAVDDDPTINQNEQDKLINNLKSLKITKEIIVQVFKEFKIRNWNNLHKSQIEDFKLRCLDLLTPNIEEEQK